MFEFAKCFCLKPVIVGVTSLIFFIVAYGLYRVLLFAFRKLAAKDRLWAKLIEELRYITLLILLESAALLSLRLFESPLVITHILNVAVIATVGWFAVGITRAFYRNFVEKTDMGGATARRSTFTQVLFLYRLLIFVIFAVTAGAILMTFPYIRSLGVGILGSAGIIGIAVGIAARPILLNLMAGFQIALTKMIQIGDGVFVEGDFGRIESIHLTHVVVCTWDWRRIILPISYFIDKPFQNWDATNSELLATVFLHCDYTVPVESIRKKAKELIAAHPKWNKKLWNVQVTNCTEQTMEIRIVASANDATAAFELRADLREKLIDFLQKQHPQALPRVRTYQFQEQGTQTGNSP